MSISRERALDIAAEYLEHNGWYIRHREWEFDHRSIDLACIDKDMTTILFVEVCTEQGPISRRGMADDMMLAASVYIHDYHLEQLPLRFDRITVKESPYETPDIIHLQNVIHVSDPYVFYEQEREREHIQQLTD